MVINVVVVDCIFWLYCVFLRCGILVKLGIVEIGKELCLEMDGISLDCMFVV